MSEVETTPHPPDAIVVEGLRLWAHVGVLDRERERGQWFEITFQLGVDLTQAAEADSLETSCDYALAITSLQTQARTIRCFTLESYSERILDLLQDLYGSIPLWVEVSKCEPPIPGFHGKVSVRRHRRWP